MLYRSQLPFCILWENRKIKRGKTSSHSHSHSPTLGMWHTTYHPRTIYKSIPFNLLCVRILQCRYIAHQLLFAFGPRLSTITGWLFGSLFSLSRWCMHFFRKTRNIVRSLTGKKKKETLTRRERIEKKKKNWQPAVTTTALCLVIATTGTLCRLTRYVVYSVLWASRGQQQQQQQQLHICHTYRRYRVCNTRHSTRW